MSFELLFDDIVRERGLSSAPDLAIARAAALLLAADDGSPVEAAAAVAKLLAMLPPKTASPVMNLSLLTDEEVSLFAPREPWLAAFSSGYLRIAYQ
jgi:hypothetical protein